MPNPREQPPADGRPAEAGRVLTTLLFTDIVGSTHLAADLGDRRWRDVLEGHHGIVRREIQRFRGQEVDSAGDGFLAIFDGPERAIRCACAIRDAVRALGIEVRAGMHAGEVEADGPSVRGIAVHLGARVASEAGPGEILVSNTVRDLVAGSGILFEDRGLHALKGVPEERRLFAVSGTIPGGASAPRLSPGAAADDLRIWLLGDVQMALGADAIDPGHWRLRKAKSLIKLLSLAPGHRLHREQVIETLWPDLEPTAASNNLRKALHVARRALGSADANRAGRYLQVQQGVIVLAPDGHLWVDLDAFERAAAQARQRGDPDAYRAALDLYGGDLVPEDRYEDWASGRREAVRLTYLSLLTDLAALHEGRRQFAPGIDVLHQLLSLDPAREEAHVALMRLYAHSGQRHRALRQYQILRDAIKREFDAEPDSATQRLHQDILSGGFPPPQAGGARPAPTLELRLRRSATLPLPLTTFVGRAREIEEIGEKIATARQLTLTGTAGVGKTRLALEVAARVQRDFPDGVWLVDFSPLSDPARVPQTVASTLGVPEETGRPFTEVAGDYLLTKRALLVLDNCEHVTAACAELTESLLRRCPDIRVLVTSRETLGTAGELVYRVPSLSLPDARGLRLTDLIDCEAVRLFADRAALSQRGFALTEANAPAIVQICTRLDGIPLAIELAAARVNALSAEAIAGRLDDRFRLLTGGVRTALPRHRTLRAAMDWGYDLLPDFERALLRRLSVFSGGFTLEAAEAVCAGDDIGEGDVLDLLARLVDKSLVSLDQSPTTRYRQLETIRQYARERLVAEREADVTMRRHRDFFVGLAERAEPEFRGAHQQEWLDRLEAEHGNVRVALEWSLGQPDAGPAMRLAAAAASFWHARGYLVEGREWLRWVLERTAEVALAPALRMKALLGAGRLAFAQDDYGTAQTIFEKVVALARECDDRHAYTLSLALLGHAAWHQGERARGVALCDESLALARALGDAWTTAIVLDEVSVVARHEGDHRRSTGLLEESLILFRRAGDVGGIALCLSRLGALAINRTDHRRAAGLVEEALTLQRALGRRTAEASSLSRLGLIALIQGEWERAERLYEAGAALADELGKMATAASMRLGAGLAALAEGDLERAETIFVGSLDVQKKFGDKDDIAGATAALGLLARYRGDHGRARQLLEESLSSFRETGGLAETAGPLYQLGTPLHQLGLLARAESDVERAATLICEALARQHERGDVLGTAKTLEGLAGVMLAQGEPERAARLFGAADALRETIGASRWPIDRAQYDREVHEAKVALGEETFRAAWSAGRAASLDEAVTFALAAR